MRKKSLHMLFSIGLLVALALGYYSFTGWPRETRAWITVLSFPVFLGCIYIGRALCRTWFTENRPEWYLLNFIPCLFAILVLWYYLVRIGFSLPRLGFLEFSIAYSPLFILGMVAGFLIKLVRSYTQKQLHEARAQTAQKENELHQLQSQLSPHFLFNTLNNMYGIAIADHQRIPKLLLKLSDLLRYSLYETGQPFVLIKDELAYIRNYIEFEKMRMSDRLILTAHLEEPADTSVRIAPMVLIVFIENAFKHSKHTLTEKVTIDISLKVNAGMIRFAASNSYNPEKKQDSLVNARSGLGLANATKRLELLYGNDYRLNTFADHIKYTVELELKAM